MKRITTTLAAASIMLGAGFATAAPAQAATYNIRTAPSTSAPVIGSLVNPNCNNLVRPIQRKTANGLNWNKVRSGNKVGWAHNPGWCI